MNTRPMTFTYKDHNRIWWKIETEIDRIDGGSEGDEDKIWKYTIFKDEEKFYYGEFWLSDGAEPCISYIMNNFASAMSSLAIGFTAHGDQI